MEKIKASTQIASIVDDIRDFPIIDTATRDPITDDELKKLRKKNKSVAMVGFSSNHRERAPLDDENIEIWGLNKLHLQDWFVRYDRMFQLHPLPYLKDCMGMSESDRQHYEWLCEPHDDLILYCQEEYEEFPSATRFPIERMRKKYRDFYTSTLAYMMALALDEGYTHIELYGYDMEADTEYRAQRDSAEYFIGLAEGLGAKVYMPKNCSLLKIGLGMYAYETMEVGFRTVLEGRAIELGQQLKEAGAQYNMIAGQIDEMTKLAEKDESLNPRIQELEMKAQEKVQLLNIINGAQSECDEIIRMFDEHYNQLTIMEKGVAHASEN